MDKSEKKASGTVKTKPPKTDPFNAIKKAWAPIVCPPVTPTQIAILKGAVYGIILSTPTMEEGSPRVSASIAGWLRALGIEVSDLSQEATEEEESAFRDMFGKE